MLYVFLLTMKNSFNSFLIATKFIAAAAALACTNTVFAQPFVESRPAFGSRVENLVSVVQQSAALVQVSHGWVRFTVPGQKGSGAFMTLTAASGIRLVGVKSAAAGVAEVHEMTMEGTIMRMRAVPGVDLPAGKAVEFKPGGFHLMLTDLKQTLVAGSSVPMTLLLQDAKGVRSQVEVRLPVALTAPGGAGVTGKAGKAAAEMDHSKH